MSKASTLTFEENFFGGFSCQRGRRLKSTKLRTISGISFGGVAFFLYFCSANQEKAGK